MSSPAEVSAAYHEAAHAVVGRAVGLSVKGVFITAAGAGLMEWWPSANGDALDLATMCLAGRAACRRLELEAGDSEAPLSEMERFLRGLPPPGDPPSETGARSDVMRAREHIETFPAAARPAMWAIAENQAKHLVTKHWSAIETMAEEMLNKRHLTAAEVQRLTAGLV